METLVKADIFFFVATIAVALFTIFLIIALYYGIIAFKRIRKLSDKVEANFDTASTEVKEIVEEVKSSFLFNFLFMRNKNQKKRLK